MATLFERLAAGELALGAWIKGGPNWVATLARGWFQFRVPRHDVLGRRLAGTRPYAGGNSTIC